LVTHTSQITLIIQSKTGPFAAIGNMQVLAIYRAFATDSACLPGKAVFGGSASASTRTDDGRNLEQRLLAVW